MLTLRDLNRTLLRRQQLLERTRTPALSMVEHLLGLQGFQPGELSDALEDRTAVRLLTMRGTIRVLTADDALALRPWVQPALDKVSHSNQLNRSARDVPVADVVAETRRRSRQAAVVAEDFGIGRLDA